MTYISDVVYLRRRGRHGASVVRWDVKPYWTTTTVLCL